MPPKKKSKRFVWSASYSSTETYEQALIRMYTSDPRIHGMDEDGNPTGVRHIHVFLAKALGTTPMAVNKKLGRLRKAGLVGWLCDAIPSRFKPLVTADKKVVDKDTPREFLDLVITGTRLIGKRDVRQEEVFPCYDYPGWVGLVIGGDWHFEHYKTDTAALIEDLEEVGREPNVLFGFNGDSVDVIDLRFLELENETVSIPVRRLYEIVEYLFSLVPNTLFMVLGCHDNWVRTRARWDILEALQEKIPGYYLGFGGTVNLTVGQSVYRIGAYHKFGWESKINNFHPCYNYLKSMDAAADIVAIAHRHDIVGVSHTFIQGRPKVFMRSGSQQYKTEYAWKEGFRGAIARWPMVLLNGTEKRMIPVTNFREGIPILRMLNSYPAISDEVVKAGGGVRLVKESHCERT